MIERLIRAAIDRKVATIGGTLALAALGLWSLTRIPFDAYPDLTGTRVDVITPAEGMSAEDVERLVTYQLESSLMGLPGAEGVRSVSKAGLSLITISFPDNVDVYFARTLVQQRLGDAKAAMPTGVEPSLGPVSTPMGELYQYAVTSDSLSLAELKTLHDYTIRPRLRTVPGVSEVNSWGGFIDQVQVTADPARLAARGLTLEDLHKALVDNNLTFGGSYIEAGGERFNIRGIGRAETLDEIGAMLVATANGSPVLVRDVATVAMGALPRHGAVTQDGKGEVVVGMVLKLKGADSRRVVAAVRARMDEVRRALPAHVAITPFYDQTELVSRTTRTIGKNLLEGGLLVVIVLFAFLRNVRASLIVASVIPLSMLVAFWMMDMFGYTANLMSLGALHFGAIVDASVVMVENFVRRLEHDRDGRDRVGLFKAAAIEVGRPIVFGIAIIIAVYIPIFTLEGMEGRMFRPMAFAMVTAVLGSLLFALTYVPAVSVWFLKHVQEKPDRIFHAVAAWYARALDWALARTRLVVGASAAAVVVAVGSMAWIGTEFMPKLDEGAILVTSRRLPSVSLAEATRISTEIEKVVRRFPEVIAVVTKEGRPDLATEAMGLFEGDTYVILKDRSEWTTAKTHEGLVSVLDTALAVIPGLDISFTQPLAMRLDEAESGIRTDLGVKVIGTDRAENARYAERIRRIIAATQGAADVSVEISEGQGQVRIAVNRDALGRYGVTVADVQRAVNLAMGAEVATELIDGPRRIGVVVRYPDASRDDVDLLRRITIRTAQGGVVTLAAVADVVTDAAPELIAHEDAQRRTLVMSNVRGRDLGSFVSEVRGRVASEVTLPRGMFLEWGGQYENQTRAMARLRIVVPFALLLICVLLYASFQSVTQAVLVLTNVPVALVGGIAMLWLRGMNLNLSASVGFIALFGIAVLNGVVLVAYFNDLITQGVELEEAVRRGAAARLRPVLMTAIVTLLGFIPMAMSTTAGSEVQRPLASVVIGGLVTSTFLTLFVLPSLYRGLMRWSDKRSEAED